MNFFMLPVVILSYNHPDITARTIKSVENRGLFPIYLVHNGSEEKNIERLVNEFPNATHLYLKNNRGYSGGANFGLKFAFEKHDWCLFLTNDCEITEIGELPKSPCLIAPQIEVRSTKRVHSIGGYFDTHSGKLSHCLTSDEFEKTHFKKYIPGTAFIIHKDVFMKTSGFDESLHTYWEDVDFSIRAQNLGFPLRSDTKWIFRHGVGKTCHKNPMYTLYYFQRNRKKITKKYTQGVGRARAYQKMGFDWAKLSLKLVRTKRYKDLRLLAKAIRD